MNERKNDFQNWSEKHRVKNFSDIKGQNEILEQIKKFFSNFGQNEKKALFLHGPTGIGKTSIAHVIANELNIEIFELNASDFRNKEQLEQKLKPALEQKSLFKKSKVILVDEIDGLSTADRGGLQELTELVQTTQFPMIITANDGWNRKFNELKKKTISLSLKEIDYKDISKILQGISQKESLNINEQILVSLAVRSKGDVRAAINDLQTVASSQENIEDYMNIDDRNKEQDIFNALKLVFKNRINNDAIRIYDSVDMPLDEIFLWIEENIPYEYKEEELFKAYEALSIADLFRGRIRNQRHWRFLIYQNILLSAGISFSKKQPKTGFTKYQRPSRILKIWMNNQRDQHKKTITSHTAQRKKLQKNFIL